MTGSGWSQPLYSAPYLPADVVCLDRSPPTAALLAAFQSVGAAPCPLSIPSLWPCPSADLSGRLRGTAAWLAWNECGVHALFDVRGPFLAARDCRADKRSIHRDSRVEVFVCPADAPAAAASGTEAIRYRGFEFNSAGRCLDFAVAIEPSGGERRFDYTWTGSAVGVMQQRQEQSQQQQQQQQQHGDDGQKADGSADSRLYRASIPWSDVGLSCAPPTGGAADLLVGVYRGEVVDGGAEHAEHVWTCWVDPLSSDVSFHTPRTFARVRLSR